MIGPGRRALELAGDDAGDVGAVVDDEDVVGLMENRVMS
jgi:hypothetical protein